MPKSRDTSWLLDPDRPALAMIEVIEFTTDNRINLPARLTDDLEWFEKSNKSVQIVSLMRLDEAGRLSLLSWKEHSAPVLKRREQLLEEAADDEEAFDALLLLEDRYQRITIERTGRLTIPLPARVHLFIEQPLYRPLYVVRRRFHLEMWSVAYRNQRVTNRAQLIDDLP